MHNQAPPLKLQNLQFQLPAEPIIISALLLSTKSQLEPTNSLHHHNNYFALNLSHDLPNTHASDAIFPRLADQKSIDRRRRQETQSQL
jgi:hypothetical protein